MSYPWYISVPNPRPANRVIIAADRRLSSDVIAVYTRRPDRNIRFRMLSRNNRYLLIFFIFILLIYSRKNGAKYPVVSGYLTHTPYLNLHPYICKMRAKLIR